MKIVFFDGHCLLCQGFVKFLWKYDTRRVFFYAPLQGATAATFLKENQRKNLNTVVFYDGQNHFEKSTAVIQILKYLGWIFRLCGFLFQIIPLFLRDHIYTIIAQNRTHWFGHTDDCLYISGSDQKFFLK
jgi:predicted DCC family thiol-disulfide oxidoreductase YuxK